MNLVHWYHLYAAGEWRDRLAEHLSALDRSGYDGPFHVGIVGTPKQRREAIAELNWIRPPDSITHADAGWEQVTLAPLHAWAKKTRAPNAIALYAHTKGASAPSTINIAWRRSMSHHLIVGWRACATELASDEFDAVGCHWLTPEHYPGNVGTAPMPCFGGNFWMARASYLRKLPPCATACRHDAEGWIGTAPTRPRVLDLTPGWPGNFAQVRYGRLIAGRAGPRRP